MSFQESSIRRPDFRSVLQVLADEALIDIEQEINSELPILILLTRLQVPVYTYRRSYCKWNHRYRHRGFVRTGLNRSFSNAVRGQKQRETDPTAVVRIFIGDEKYIGERILYYIWFHASALNSKGLPPRVILNHIRIGRSRQPVFSC